MKSALSSFSQRLVGLLHSVRFRLALWFVLILGVVMLLFSGFIYTRLLSDLRVSAIRRLSFQTRRFEVMIPFPGQEALLDNLPSLFPDPLARQELPQEQPVLAQVSLDGMLQQPINGDPAAAAALARAALGDLNSPRKSLDLIYAIRQPGALLPVEYAVMLIPTLLQDSPDVTQVQGYLLAAIQVDPMRQQSRLLLTLALGLALTLGLALAGGFWLADRAMRPVKQITQAARSIGETDLSRRLNLSAKDELGEMARTFDAMLERLQAAFERQRQFTADASHELRTPLTIIDLEASRALAGAHREEEYQRAARVIHSENQYMIHLVNNLLTLARMDAGQQKLSQEPQDLSDLALEVIERLASLAARQGVRLVAGELPELPITGDRQLLVQMITNLVENAIKYNHSADPHVWVETGLDTSSAGAWCTVRIRDNGPGIAPEHLPRLFDRFYQVDPARTRPNPEDDTDGRQVNVGAGLGLAIARWIARAHKGGVSVTSEVGQGTIFEVRLPRAPAPQLAAVTPSSPTETPPDPGSPGEDGQVQDG